jgi:hypothetical protein
MKKTLNIIILLVISLFGYVFIKTVQFNPPASVNSVVTNVQSINEQTKVYSIQAEYPVFPAQKIFSDLINSYVNQRISYFKKTAQDNWNEQRFNKPFDFNLAWISTQINQDFVSFNLKVEYFIGGANVNQEIKTFNWDLKKNKEIVLADLFAGDSGDYLIKVSDYCRNNLIGQFAGQLVDDELIAEGTSPKLENFQRFNFDNTKIIFYFPKYQVAPGAAGDQTVIMYRNGGV